MVTLWIIKRPLKLQMIFPFVPVAAPLIEADKETDEQNYLLWRLQKGVAEGSTEIPKGILLFPP